MAAKTPITDAERAAILDLHAAGLSARAIARSVGRSYSACARVVRESGAKTDTTQTADATAARVRRANAQKLTRAEELLAEADELRRGLHDPIAEVVNTTAGPMWVERDPHPREIKTTVDAVTRLLDTAGKLLDSVNVDDNAESRSLLSNIMAGLTEYRATLDDPPPADGA